MPIGFIVVFSDGSVSTYDSVVIPLFLIAAFCFWQVGKIAIQAWKNR